MKAMTEYQPSIFRERVTKYAWPKWKPDFVMRSADALPAAIESGMLEDINHFMFDVDGTLMDHHAKEVPKDMKHMLKWLVKREKTVSIISNAYDGRAEEITAMFAAVDKSITVVTPAVVAGDLDPRLFRKPHPAMAEYLIEKSETIPAGRTAVVGDQIMKDIVVGNTAELGATILVDKYGKHDDPNVARYQRPIELLARTVLGLPRGSQDFPETLTERDPAKDKSDAIAKVAAGLGAATVAFAVTRKAFAQRR